MSAFWQDLWYRRGGGGLAAMPLAAASGMFRLSVAVKNALYDGGILTPTRVAGLRVISVGNLNVGGAGKTPAVLLLAERALAAGLPVAVLSRGYGRRHRDEREVLVGSTSDEAGDEPLLLKRRLPLARVYVGADRIRLAQRALADGARLAILDDGFQHRRLHRDIDVLVIDDAMRFGNGKLLPSGPLREPIRSARRAQLLWRRLGEEDAPPLGQTLSALPTVSVRPRPLEWVAPNGIASPLSSFASREVYAFCGLAQPDSFARTLYSIGLAVELRAFADHHRYGVSELDELLARANGRPLVTTEKDAMRLPNSFPAHSLRLGLEVVDGDSLVSSLWADL